MSQPEQAEDMLEIEDTPPDETWMWIPYQTPHHVHEATGPDLVAAIAAIARQVVDEAPGKLDADLLEAPAARLARMSRAAAVSAQLARAVLELQRHVPGPTAGARTHGTISYASFDSGPAWVIDAAPYVRVWMRRLFPKAASIDRKGKLRVSASVARTADLEWAMRRYPLEFHPGAVEPWRERLAAHVEREAAVAALEEPNYTPPLFAELALPPRDYQRIAADHWIRVRRTLIADDLGLGKTISALAALTDQRLRPALVVTLTHLTRQWRREVNRFLPGLRVHVINKGKPYALDKVDRARSVPDVLIVNYHKLAGWQDALGDRVRSVIFDECQELRISDSLKYKAAARIADGAEWRCGLSATPVYNYGSEVWTIFDVLDPGRLGTKTEFLSEWCGGKGVAQAEADAAAPALGQPSSKSKSVPVDDPVALGSFMRATGAMVRRTRRDVGRELPALQQIVQSCDADLDKLAEVNDRVTELAKLLIDPETEHELRFKAGAEIDWRMRQATGIAKAPFVAEFVKLLVESGAGKVLLYGWHHAVYDLWLKQLADFNPVRFTGEESVNQKDQARSRFIDDKHCQVMIMSVRAGAGLDGLQKACRTVVVGELDWSPKVHDQAIGRVHRDGQRDPVLAYLMVSAEGSDPVVADVLGLKEVQAAGVIGQEASLFKANESGDHIRRLAQSILDKRGRPREAE